MLLGFPPRGQKTRQDSVPWEAPEDTPRPRPPGTPWAGGTSSLPCGLGLMPEAAAELELADGSGDDRGLEQWKLAGGTRPKQSEELQFV